MGKHTSTAKYITVEDEVWEINSGYSKQGYPLPIYTKQMRGIINQLNIMTTRYSRVLIVLFDLHLSEHTNNNEIISQFRKLVCARITKKYSFKQIGFSWCREFEHANQQHYHMAFFLEGRKIRAPEYLYQILQDAWLDIGGGHFHMAGYHMVERNDWQTKQDAIYHLSYHAKKRGKGTGYRPAQTKDYGLSRLKENTF